MRREGSVEDERGEVKEKRGGGLQYICIALRAPFLKGCKFLFLFEEDLYQRSKIGLYK